MSPREVSRLASRDLPQVSLPDPSDGSGAATGKVFARRLGQDRILFPEASRGESHFHDL